MNRSEADVMEHPDQEREGEREYNQLRKIQGGCMNTWGIEVGSFGRSEGSQDYQQECELTRIGGSNQGALWRWELNLDQCYRP